MATISDPLPNRPVAIAPAPSNGTASISDQSAMPYTCQTCTKRKIKCDKLSPTCSSCRKGKLECFYQAPPPRRRKRKLSVDANDKIARYERILQQHGLLPDDADGSPSLDETLPERKSIQQGEAQKNKPGTFLAKEDKTRYYDSNFWFQLKEEEVHPEGLSDEEEEDEDQMLNSFAGDVMPDPLTGAFMGYQRNLFGYHPTYAEAMTMWKAYAERVEPLFKALHLPSTFTRIELVAQQPATASKADECLLFGIYHFAVVSLTAEECELMLAQPKQQLLDRYGFAARQALVNASFLKTTDMSVLQAFAIHLLCNRHSYDPHTNYILAGAMMRIAQRMGIHRDGAALGLPPFEAEMRRRLFYVIIPIDGAASQMAGSDMPQLPVGWDVQPALNINDDQLWPGMTEPPKAQTGATEMIFCLTRATIGRRYVGADKEKLFDNSEQTLDDTEREVEERFIRYCDILNPLHFLTVGFARSAICAMRLRSRLAKAKNENLSNEAIQANLPLALRILDTDAAAHQTATLKKFFWHIGAFFAWGTFDSIIFILTTLRKGDVLTRAQVDDAWTRIIQVYTHHAELLEHKRAIQIAIGRLTLRAWKSNPPTLHTPEPVFITTMRSNRKINPEAKIERHASSATTSDTMTDIFPSFDPSPSSDANALFGSLSDSISLGLDTNFNLDTADWQFWQSVINDYQSQATQG